MLKNLFLFSVLAVLGFLGWKHFTKPPEMLTPEQEVNQVVNQAVIPAKDLAFLCMKHPRLVTRALQGKTVAVSGVLSKALVLGVKSNDLSLELVGTPPLKISFQSDFGKNDRWGGQAGSKFQKKGNEILALSVVKIPVGEKQNADKIYTQLDTSSEAAVLQSIIGKMVDAYGAVKSSKASNSSESQKTAEKTVERAICREGGSLTLRGNFRHIGTGWVKFDLVELP